MATNARSTYKLKAAETTVTKGCFSIFDGTTEGQVKNPAGAGVAQVAGVMIDTSLAAGISGNYQRLGFALVKAANGSISQGDDLVISDSLGRVKSKPASNTSGTDIVARAEENSNAAGDLIRAFVDINPISS